MSRHAASAALVAVPIRAYRRFVSPLLPARCRFHPTCSAYALEAVRSHGAVRGSILAAWRVARCHPWTAGGVDLVPPPRSQRPTTARPKASSRMDGP